MSEVMVGSFIFFVFRETKYLRSHRSKALFLQLLDCFRQAFVFNQPVLSFFDHVTSGARDLVDCICQLPYMLVLPSIEMHLDVM